MTNLPVLCRPYHCFHKVIDIEFDGRAKDDCNIEEKSNYYNFVLIWDEYE